MLRRKPHRPVLNEFLGRGFGVTNLDSQQLTLESRSLSGENKPQNQWDYSEGTVSVCSWTLQVHVHHIE